MKTIRPFGVALLAAAISTPALADDDIQTVYLNPFAGYQYFGDKRDLDEEATYGFGLEYRFLPQWAVEAVYSRSEPDRKYTNGDVDFEEMRVDGLYYFGSQSDKLNPYLAAGVGHADFDGGTVTTPGTEHDETRVNLGGGLRYNVTDLVSLRGDVRAFHGIDESTFDAQVSAGISLAFSRGTSEPEPEPAPAPAPEPDADGDGVPDNRDQCPNTVAGAAVDSNGCELDSDGDGVVDRLDECPGTARGTEVDETGCEVVTIDTITLYITFPVNSAEIGSEYDDDIREVADAMKEDQEVSVEIAGHTDSTGAADYNQQLSQRRAEAVADRLVEMYGIDVNRVTPVGYGEAEPVATNETSGGRARNRRVEARLQVRR
ncbi:MULTISPECIES: OmpA family protein [Marinobacter]|uniref:OmpA-OmpF porin, OOP family n=1 Tax=Marinobacter segnicrescens TaxID=430453 RepID=A0A1I0EIS8_9GAMM|nr:MULTISPECIES: OmpA family protein [Marinobacter]UZD65472.1 OmpA family protein [Marinobacter sp. AN1]SET45243.1 OmpA-OmpF porin, OOP family [Marinobacter segnicrescens]